MQIYNTVVCRAHFTGRELFSGYQCPLLVGSVWQFALYPDSSPSNALYLFFQQSVKRE